MRANKDYYKEEFGAELDELNSTYYALIQAVANVEGIEVRLYEYEDFDGTSLPLRQYEPDRDEPHAIVYVLNDGDAHYALSPHPSLEPDDAEEQKGELFLRPSPRMSHASCIDANFSRVYFFGGSGLNIGSENYNDLWQFNLHTLKFMEVNQYVKNSG